MVFAPSCNFKQNHISQRYEGMWAETLWVYDFRSDGKFNFKSEGHLGGEPNTGTYAIIDSLILLNPDTNWGRGTGLSDRLKIINANCIRDFNNNFYCVIIDSINMLNEPEYKFQASVILIIKSLEIVKDEIVRVQSVNTDKQNDYQEAPTIEYQGIIVINKKEFHEFDLMRYELPGEHYYLRFLTSKKPLQIHLLNNKNEIDLVYGSVQ